MPDHRETVGVATRPSTAPWYTRGGVIAAIVVGVLVLGGGGIALINSLASASDNAGDNGGSGGTGGDGGSGGTGGGSGGSGGRTPSTPTPDPPPEVSCWDGSTTTTTCPPLEGAEAASWLFNTDVAGESTCAPNTGGAVGPPEESFVCTYADFPGQVVLLRYASPEAAAQAWRDWGYEESSWYITDVPDPAGPRFTGEFTTDDEEVWADEVRCLTQVGWCFEVEAPDVQTVDAGLGRIAIMPIADILAALETM